MISFKQTVSITEVFHFQTPRLGYSFLAPASFKIIQLKFSSRISIFSPIDWPLTFDYSNL